jgi:hypothetical protein
MPGKRKMFNGVPCFKVDADDFMYIAACATMNKRLLSKNIKNDELREFYINSRVPKFTIDYNGVILSW